MQVAVADPNACFQGARLCAIEFSSCVLAFLTTRTQYRSVLGLVVRDSQLDQLSVEAIRYFATRCYMSQPQIIFAVFFRLSQLTDRLAA